MRKSKTFRLPGELVDRLLVRASRERVPMTRLVEEALTRFLDAEGGDAGTSADARRQAAAEPPAPADPPERRELPRLAVLVAARSGIPVALCALKVKGGRVSVGGEVVRDPDAAVDGQVVKLDGVAV